MTKMTPGQEDQFRLIIESFGIWSANRYRELVESPACMEAGQKLPDFDWTVPGQKKQLQYLNKAEKERRTKFNDYGNIRPLPGGRRKRNSRAK